MNSKELWKCFENNNNLQAVSFIEEFESVVLNKEDNTLNIFYENNDVKKHWQFNSSIEAERLFLDLFDDNIWEIST